ncbi:MAG: isoprenylcysteine carboxylmethyltransferase family protein [Ardenticatenaceae bacterium]|nr:isoprenylcysteine carboxylmethyltransferase family protein [Anaerolineales bacterium]MCB8920570.1 isoprenylcysteine carboxylmethyltransferase family protein [Ardenticatenaceae bacterium]MCB8990193.1 isoprenylcysteine carboxylmethyltransferase family protein [Ardenticatenaceae bacterium]MCB9003016.1 isoprenylcysteine carboxylmethyltransferase family protein [Ardenticatenaceae bacterium]
MTYFILSFISWAIVHSLTADARVKERVRHSLGDRAYKGLYRLGYNVFAMMTIAPVVLVLWTKVPPTLLWQIPKPYDLVGSAVQLVGLIGLLIALLQTDIWEFVGVRQALLFMTGMGKGERPSHLVTTGMYAFVRHPLYFFSLLMLWPTPTMTAQTLLMNLLATTYLWAGSRVEERRLAAEFGEAYTTYKQRVPGLLPIKWGRDP